MLENYKRALLDMDRMHTKSIVELKHILEKVNTLKRLRDNS